VLAVAGLILLALSLVGTAESDQHPAAAGVIIRLAACGGAALLIAMPTRLTPEWGLSPLGQRRLSRYSLRSPGRGS
jgi:hypothetical protein